MEQYAPVFLVVAIVAVIALVYLWTQYNALKSRLLELEEKHDSTPATGDNKALAKERARVKELEAELKSARKASSSPSKSEPASDDSSKAPAASNNAEMQKLKSDLSDRSKQIDSLKKENKALQGKVQKLTKSTPKQRSQESNLLSLREELMEAKTDAENFKTRALKAEAALEEAKTSAPAPVKEAPKTAPSDVDVDALESSHRAALKAAQDEHQKALKDLQKGHKKAIREAKSELVDELKSVRAELRKAQRDVGEQRRRARNNDKAYKITKLQLDAMREKLALIDPETIAPGGYFDPDSEAKRIQKAREDQSDRQEEAQQQAAASALAALVSDSPSVPTLPSVSDDPLSKLGIEPVSLEDDWGLGTPSLDELLSTTDLKTKQD